MGNSSKIRNGVCPFCGKDTMMDSYFCIQCGKDLSEVMTLEEADSFYDLDCTVTFCKSCGKDVPLGACFCSNCGASMKTPDLIPPQPPVDRGGQQEQLQRQIRMLEVAYIKAHGLEVASPEADDLFPFTWFSSCTENHLEALAEAIAKKIRIIETDVWNQKMTEGVRHSVPDIRADVIQRMRNKLSELKEKLQLYEHEIYMTEGFIKVLTYDDESLNRVKPSLFKEYLASLGYDDAKIDQVYEDLMADVNKKYTLIHPGMLEDEK